MKHPGDRHHVLRLGGDGEPGRVAGDDVDVQSRLRSVLPRQFRPVPEDHAVVEHVDAEQPTGRGHHGGEADQRPTRPAAGVDRAFGVVELHRFVEFDALPRVRAPRRWREYAIDRAVATPHPGEREEQPGETGPSAAAPPCRPTTTSASAPRIRRNRRRQW